MGETEAEWLSLLGGSRVKEVLSCVTLFLAAMCIASCISRTLTMGLLCSKNTSVFMKYALPKLTVTLKVSISSASVTLSSWEWNFSTSLKRGVIQE